MENLQIFFFLGLAIWVISILAVFTANLCTIMKSPARNSKIILISLIYMFLFSLLAGSLITRVLLIVFLKE